MMQTEIAARDFSFTVDGSLDIHAHQGIPGATAGRLMIVVVPGAGGRLLVDGSQLLDVETPAPPGGWKAVKGELDDLFAQLPSQDRPKVTVTRNCDALSREVQSCILDHGHAGEHSWQVKP